MLTEKKPDLKTIKPGLSRKNRHVTSYVDDSEELFHV